MNGSIGGLALVLDLLSLLKNQGWRVYASIGQKHQRNNGPSSSTDTWHCCRQLGWSPGQSIYHH
ncbi:hypothetical protein PG990_006441 [Apiospora arundinis]|uniref:DUF605 multi-domain protein n=1 Tax=Apiospora arundinis TaxID=335852 RepID=A0ABR2JA63_9PEZI